jgi:hypothetical protein
MAFLSISALVVLEAIVFVLFVVISWVGEVSREKQRSRWRICAVLTSVLLYHLDARTKQSLIHWIEQAGP